MRKIGSKDKVCKYVMITEILQEYSEFEKGSQKIC